MLSPETARRMELQRMREVEERERLNRDLMLAIQASQRNTDIRQLLQPHLQGLLEQVSDALLSLLSVETLRINAGVHITKSLIEAFRNTLKGSHDKTGSK
jgi:hypothetical protein